MRISTIAAALTAALLTGPAAMAGTGPSDNPTAGAPQPAIPAAVPGAVTDGVAGAVPAVVPGAVTDAVGSGAPAAAGTPAPVAPDPAPSIFHSITKGKKGIQKEVLVVPIPADPSQAGPMPITLPNLNYQAFQQHRITPRANQHDQRRQHKQRSQRRHAVRPGARPRHLRPA
ncbi:hypothetical protein JOL79_33250 [Microbispora sp. RL4-1S]|uniref:Uncharacterized protein n=1 Tax=Microbispora oryzae TaxID=2806554 RepID=A0A940WN25_9ACTN|nr:hypothetical protein [Microbispora oryzae]MBP2708650.1 hypothetical protein [Microbispora oryzae]